MNISKNCNAGMENRREYYKYYISKTPYFLTDLVTILNDSRIKIKYLIVPIRKYEDSASSRAFNTSIGGINCNGGFWDASNEEEQLAIYHKEMANLIYLTTKHDIKVIFLDFDKMISNQEYLFEKLKIILDEKNIQFELFSNIYKEAELTSKPKKLIKDLSVK
jgi:hypothetical protein